VSLDYTAGKMRDIEDAMAPLVASGEVTQRVFHRRPGRAANRGFMVMTLADWEDRDRSQQEIVAEINAGCAA
jgi:hydrophobic/amphiphilic exporter-1 (mainly G- bacteria), HAE1 family